MSTGANEELSIKLSADVADFARAMTQSTAKLTEVAAAFTRTKEAAEAPVASMQKFVENATHMGEKIEMVSKQFKKLGKLGAEVGLGISAAITAAFLAGADYDPVIAKQVKELKDIFGTLAAEIARAVLPAVREFATMMRHILGWVQNLNPELKEQITHYAGLAVKIGGLLVVLGKVGGVVSDLAEFFTKILIPLAPFAALIAGIAIGGIALVTSFGFVREAMEGAFGENMRARVLLMLTAVEGIAQALRQVKNGDLSAAFKSAKATAKAVTLGGQHLPDSGPLFGGKDPKTVLLESFKRGAKDIGDAIKNSLGDLLGSGGKEGKIGHSAKDKKEDFTLKGIIEDMEAREEQIAKGQQAYGDAIDRTHKRLKAAWQQGEVTLQTAATEAIMSAQKTLATIEESFNAGGAAGFAGGVVFKVSGGEQKFQAAAQAAQAQYADDMMAAQGILGDGEKKAAEITAKAHYESAISTAKVLTEKIGKMGALLANIIMSKMGRVGQLLDTAIQGFQTAGPWGALIAVIVDLVTETEGFKEAITELEMGLKETVAVIDMSFAPFGDLGDALKFMTDASVMPLFYVIKYVTLAILYAGKGIAAAVNWINQAWEDIKAFFGMRQREIVSAVNMDGINAAIDKMTNSTYENMSATARATDETNKNTAAMKKFNEQFTNVPEGFKIKAAQFNSMNSDGPDLDVRRTPDRAGPADITGGGVYSLERPTLTINIDGNLVGNEEFLRELMARMSRKGFQKSGYAGTHSAKEAGF